MNVFFVTKDYKEKLIELNPKIPKSIMKIEDSITPRICVSSSLNGYLSSIDGLCNYDKLYVYETNVSDIYQPTESQVPDAFLTGELWILEKCKFNIIGSVIIRGYCGLAIGSMENNQYIYDFKGE